LCIFKAHCPELDRFRDRNQQITHQYLLIKSQLS